MSDSSTNLQTDHWNRHPTETATFGVCDSNAPVHLGEGSVTEALESSGRYKVLGELGRGGMGVVYRALDDFLGREIAVKAIRSGPGASSLISRFVDEALVMSQLQHPAIPSIYELTIIGGLPFLMMKRIKGVTLAEKIKTATTASDRSELIAIFEQVCQAVAYAHGRRIIHRDLKPSNIMVGAFGEVQVMDWGLAKKLEALERASAQGSEAPNATEPPTEVRTTRGADSDQTSPGSVLGTPAITCPEQSGGELDKIDERVDVFGLGAVLCAILTGLPPYIAETSDQIRLMSIRGDLDDAFARVNQCGADPELIALCRECLAPEASRRPRDAKAVADAVTAYRIGVQERLRAAQESALVSAAEAREQRKRRRVQLALVSSVFLLIACTGAGVAWSRQQHSQRMTEAVFTAEDALAKAEQLAARASALKKDVTSEAITAPALANEVASARAAEGLWREAAAEAEQAESVISSTRDSDLSIRFASRIARIRDGLELSQAELSRVQREHRLLTGLEHAHDLAANWIRVSSRRARDAYEQALVEAGLPAHGPAEALGAAIVRESPRVRAAILDSIDHWAESQKAPADAKRIREAANLVDPDPFRRRIRAAVARNAKAELIELAGLPETNNLPPLSAILLGRALVKQEEHRLAARLLHVVLEKNPADYRALIEMAFAVRVLPRDKSLGWRDTLSCCRSALALRPDSALAVHLVGCALLQDGDAAGAEAHFHRALAIDDAITNAWYNLGCIAEHRNNAEKAIEYFGKAVECDPDFPEARSGLGVWLFNTGDLVRAELQLTRSIQLKQDQIPANVNLGCLQMKVGKTQEALLSYGNAVLLDPKGVISRINWADMLAFQLNWTEAEIHYRIALPLGEKSPLPSKSLGWFYLMRGRLFEAEPMLRKAIELDPRDGQSHALLGSLLERRGDRAGAQRCYDEALKAAPEGGHSAHFDSRRLKSPPATAAALERILEETLNEHPKWELKQQRLIRLAAGIAAFRASVSDNAAIDLVTRSQFRSAALKLISGVVKELQDDTSRRRESNAEELLNITMKLIGDAELEPLRGPLSLFVFAGAETGDWLKLWGQVHAAHTTAFPPVSQQPPRQGLP